MAPAKGLRFRAIGRVVRAGRTLSVCTGELRASSGEGETVIAVMQATMMTVEQRPGISD
jgi:acyl-coenzyme A thioesterase PaaI-like protein